MATPAASTPAESVAIGVRGLTPQGHKGSRRAPEQPCERDSGENAPADEDLDVHVVAVEARVRAPQVDVRSVEQSKIVRADTAERMVREHPGGGAPEQQAPRPLVLARHRRRTARAARRLRAR